MAKLRIGVVGLGKMGLLHGAIFNSLPDSAVVAVAEPVETLRKTLTLHNPGLQACETINEMVERTPLDAVAITTPVAYHTDACLLCLERKLPFFVEKPLAASVAQARQLVDALQRTPVPHMVGFMTRFVDSFAKAKEFIPCLGRLQRVTGTIYVSQLFTRGKGWRYDRKVSGGGVLLSQGAHLLDLLTWYFGPVRRVNAEVISAYSEQIEDFGHVMLEFQSGLRCWVDCSWSVRGKRTVETTIEALGDNGALTVTDDTVRLFLDEAVGGMPAGRTLLRATDLWRPVPVDIAQPQYTHEDVLFVESVRAGKPMQPDARQGLHVQQIVEAAYESAAAAGAPRTI
jgi:predicted dehydrogenase